MIMQKLSLSLLFLFNFASSSSSSGLGFQLHNSSPANHLQYMGAVLTEDRNDKQSEQFFVYHVLFFRVCNIAIIFTIVYLYVLYLCRLIGQKSHR